MKTMAKGAMGLAIVALVFGIGIRVHAAPIMLSMSGNLAGYPGPGIAAPTTLGGVTLGVTTPFTLNAWFDTSTGFIDPDGASLYQITSFTMLIGETNYTGIPNDNLNVYLLDPSMSGGFGYGVGIADDNGWSGSTPTAIVYGWSTATPSLDVTAPTPTDFSSPYFWCYSAPINIPLEGVTGGLQINDNPSGYAVVYPQYDPTVSASLIPEPGSMALFGLLGGAIILRRRLLRHRAC